MPGPESKPPAAVSASVTAAGGRPDNQDRCGEGPTAAGRAWIVADGLGGHAAGDLAADCAVGAVLGALADRPALRTGEIERAFEAARDAIAALQRARPAARGCRTTAVVLALEGGRALWGHVGDSRLYHLRGGRVVEQTRDHSVPQALVQAGVLAAADVRHHPDRNRLLRCIGGDEPVEATLLPSPVAVEAGDAFLLCSDGFWELVDEVEMERSLAAARDPADWLRRMETALLARATGAFDNYTATAVVLRDGSAPGAARARGLGALATRLRGRLAGAPRLRGRARLQSAPDPPGPRTGAVG